MRLTQKLKTTDIKPVVDMARTEPYDEDCCMCRGSCMHTGPHSYCDRHYDTYEGRTRLKIKVNPEFASQEAIDKIEKELGIK